MLSWWDAIWQLVGLSPKTDPEARGRNKNRVSGKWIFDLAWWELSRILRD